MSNIQIPMIFDVSGGGTIYGESIAEDVVTAHLKFDLNRGGTNSSASFIAAMKKILYADEADSEASGVYFYKDDTTTAAKDAIGDAIKALLFSNNLDTTIDGLITHSGAGISEPSTKLLANFGYAAPAGTTGITTDTAVQAEWAGIPLGKDQTSLSSWTPSCYYQDDFIDATGATISTVLIRVAATHLMGHPFAQGFIQENTISDDLYNTNFKNQVESANGFNIGNLTQATKGSTVNHGDGVKVPILQTIYEQLIQVNPAEHREPDEDNLTDSAGSSIAQELVFKAGNTVTFYIRPRLYLKLDEVQGITSVTNSTTLGTTLAAAGIDYNSTTGVSSTPEETFAKIFTSGTPSAEGYYWLTVKDYHGDATNASDAKRGNNETLSQWTTNHTWGSGTGVDSEKPSNKHVAMFDAHIWRITVTI